MAISRPWSGPRSRWAALVAATLVAIGVKALTVATASALPPLRPAALPTLGPILVNAVRVVVVVTIIVALGWTRQTGATVGRVRRPVLLLPPAAVALAGTVPGLDLSARRVLAVVALMVTLSVAEELTARGLQLRLLDPLGPVAACVVGGTIFGLGHAGNAVFFGQPWPETVGQVVGATIFGVVYAALRLHVGALWPLVGLHALDNSVAELARGPAPAWLLGASAVAGVAYAVGLLRGARFNRSRSPGS